MHYAAQDSFQKNTDTPYVYVLIRTDLPLQHQITQACHAALEIGFDSQRPMNGDADAPVHLITLAVKNESDLLSAAERLNDNGIRHHTFFEPDECNGSVMRYTALASEPVYGLDRKIFNRYNLWMPVSVDE